MSRGLLPGGLRNRRLCVQFSLVPLEDHMCKYGLLHETQALVVVNTASARRQGATFYRSEAGAIFAPQQVPANCIVTVTNLASRAIIFEATQQCKSPEEENIDGQATKRRKCSIAAVDCLRCRALLPIGTVLCPNCMLRSFGL